MKNVTVSLVDNATPHATKSQSELERENRILRARLDTLGFLASEIEPEIQEPVSSLNNTVENFTEFEFNSIRDCSLSHNYSDFGKILHIFNAEYFGIRAAAGNLPGHKLSVVAERKLSQKSISDIMNRIDFEGYQKFVLHGYSANMDVLARNIYRASGSPMYCVWHGNFAQLVYKAERDAFERWLGLQDAGIVSKAHILKHNSSNILKHGYNPMLLNLPPVWTGSRISAAFENSSAGTALLPSWIDIRKNWHSNMFAAAYSTNVDSIIYYADVRPIGKFNKKIEKVNFDIITHLDIVSSVDIVLNATLVDCHPMVDLEGLACQTPVITGKLFLGELDSHPYTRLTCVENSLDYEEIITSINRVSSISSNEITEMMNDYKEKITNISISRYREFLEI